MSINNNDSISKDYLKIVYAENTKPFTDYPAALTKYLFNTYDLKVGSQLLDLGCGRGEFLNGFISMGLAGYGVDFSNASNDLCPKAFIMQADIEKDGLPYDDNFFDVIFSKSVIEHFYNPDILVDEIYRCLKPGGLVIVMAPAWEYNYKIYFEDYTHRSPFMKQSLNDILLIHSFDSVDVRFFKQLPLLWSRLFSPLRVLSFLTRILLPRGLSKYFKWVRFSKEVMLLATAKKPISK